MALMFGSGLPRMSFELVFWHQGCSDLGVGWLMLDFHRDGGVPARTPMLKLGSARGTKYIVYEVYLISMVAIYL